eukprot:scaffold6949_cov107-Cylindrotheca_fusiformis.AAC.4
MVNGTEQLVLSWRPEPWMVTKKAAEAEANNPQSQWVKLLEEVAQHRASHPSITVDEVERLTALILRMHMTCHMTSSSPLSPGLIGLELLYYKGRGDLSKDREKWSWRPWC